MRFFALLNLQHIAAVVFPTLAFMLVFGAGLSYSRFKANRSHRESETQFVDGIVEGHSPFPLVMILIIETKITETTKNIRQWKDRQPNMVTAGMTGKSVHNAGAVIL